MNEEINNAKAFYSKKPRLFTANSYASQILDDLGEERVRGLECDSIAAFYQACSAETLETITAWNHAVFGKDLCDLVDAAIDESLSVGGLKIGQVSRVEICSEGICPVVLYAYLVLDADIDGSGIH